MAKFNSSARISIEKTKAVLDFLYPSPSVYLSPALPARASTYYYLQLQRFPRPARLRTRGPSYDVLGAADGQSSFPQANG